MGVGLECPCIDPYRFVDLCMYLPLVCRCLIVVVVLVVFYLSVLLEVVVGKVFLSMMILGCWRRILFLLMIVVLEAEEGTIFLVAVGVLGCCCFVCRMVGNFV